MTDKVREALRAIIDTLDAEEMGEGPPASRHAAHWQKLHDDGTAALAALDAPAEGEGWRKQPWMSVEDWNSRKWLDHDGAMQTILDAASVTTLSYQEAALIYARGRGFIVDDARMMADPPEARS